MEKRTNISTSTSSITGKYGSFDPTKIFPNDEGLIDIVDFKNFGKGSNRASLVHFDETGDKFIASDAEGNVFVFYMTKNRFVNICKIPNLTTICISDKHNGIVFVATPNKTIEVYSLNGKLVQTLKGHKNSITALKVNTNRNLLMSCSKDAVFLWNLNNYKVYKTLHAKAQPFSTATFSPDGDSLITSFQNSTIYFWNLSSFQVDVKLILNEEVKVTQLASSLDCKYLVASGESNKICLVNLSQTDSDPSYFEIPRGSNGIRDIHFFKESYFSFIGSDNSIYLADIDCEKIRLLHSKIVSGKAVLKASFDILGQYSAAVSSTGEIYLYDVKKALLKPSSLIRPGIEIQSLELKSSSTKTQERDGATQHSLNNNFESSSNKIEDEKKTLKKKYNNQTLSEKKSTKSNTANLNETHKSQTEFDGNTKSFDALFKTARIDTNKTALEKNKLKSLFSKYGVFPEKHRALIWRYLLNLPLNQEAFNNLVSLGIHSSYQNLQNSYPLKSKTLLIKLQRILSALANFSPVFSEVSYLPAIIFPFVKLFGNDELLCFEIILSIFMQWGQNFFEYFPNPPLTMIQGTEELLKFHDYELADHLKKLGLNMVDYVWPFLQTFFTEMLTKEDWLSLFDFFMLNYEDPIYINLFVVSYLIYFRATLLNTNEIESVDYFIKKQNAVNIQKIINIMTDLMKKTPNSAITVSFKQNLPLISGQYPIFDMFPKYTVENYKSTREKLQDEEMKLETRKEQIKQIHDLTEDLLKQETLFREKQEALARTEKDRKELLIYEDEMRLQQKLKIETESRDRRLNQLKALEKTVQSSLTDQEKLRAQEFDEFEKELEMRNRIENFVIQSRLEEEALLNLEFQAAQRLNEMIEARNKEERSRRLRMELDQRDRLNRMRERMLDDNTKAEDEEFKLKIDLLRQQKLMELNVQQEKNDKQELENRLMVEDFEKELRAKDVERQRRLRKIAEEEVLKNEEFMRAYKEHEDVLKREEERQIKRFLEEERENAIRRAEDRLAKLEQEKRVQAQELENYREKLRHITNEQKKREFEDRILEISKENQLRLLEEEKNIQRAILEIEEEKKVQKEMQYELLIKEKEYNEKKKFYNSLKDEEERVLNEEKMKFDEFRYALKEELNKVDEVKQKMNEAKLQEIRNQTNALIKQRTDDLRNKIQTDYMQNYIEEIKHDQRTESSHLDRESDAKSNDFSRSPSTRHEEPIYKKTGTFKSPTSTVPYLGQSTSSYTYSETLPDENIKNKKQKSASKYNAIYEAQEIISRHQQKPIVDNYYESKVMRHANQNVQSSQNFTISSQVRTSQEDDFAYKDYTGSPDNLTYSSLEASTRKDDRHYIRDDF